MYHFVFGISSVDWRFNCEVGENTLIPNGSHDQDEIVCEIYGVGNNQNECLVDALSKIEGTSLEKILYNSDNLIQLLVSMSLTIEKENKKSVWIKFVLKRNKELEEQRQATVQTLLR